MKASVLVIAAATALAASAAYAQSGADVLKSKGCLNCHEADKKKVGPSFKDIAAKSQGKQAELVAKLKEGPSQGRRVGRRAERCRAGGPRDKIV